jgi:DNA-binding transcriptional ArsR family regulator
MTEGANEAAPPSPGPEESVPSVHPRRDLLSAIGDPVALEILAALSAGDRDVHALVVQTGLPQSSLYRKVRELTANGLVTVPRLAFTKDGRKVELFRSRLRAVRVLFGSGRYRVEVRFSEDSSDRLVEMWDTVGRFAR